MLKNDIVSIVICITLITAGCSVYQGGNKSKVSNENPTKTLDNKNIVTITPTTSQNGNSKNKNNTDEFIQYNYTLIFKSAVIKAPVNISNISECGNTLQLNYTGNFSNKSRTTSEMAYLTTIFAEVLNQSYHSKYDWNISRINIIGSSSNGSTVWDFRTEDWWSMNYIRGDWTVDSYLNATFASGHHWNVATGQPEPGGGEYIFKLRNKLQSQTNIEVTSLNKHGGEAFLTYETDRELNSSRYYDQVANVTDVYKNLTLPRSLNRTDGWYAGVLNIEVRNGNDTLEWYRYQIRWAEDRVNGEMTKEEEAGRLRLSRFLERDRLRDGNETAG
jgi:hypothetical protein